MRGWSNLVAGCLALAASTAGAADQALIDAAKKEGVVTWYTTQIVNQFAKPAAEAFEKKYGVRVDFTRNDPGAVVMRVMGEAKAGRVQADVFDSAPVVTALKTAGLAVKWMPDSARRLDAKFVDADGYWTATNIYVLTPARNTDLVKNGTEPKSWEDLLDPKYKGRMAWNSQIPTAGAAGFVGLVLTEYGEEKGRAYLRRLAAQNIAPLGVAARQVVDQMMAGEYAIALQIFNNHPVISAAQGAPADFIPLNPAFEYASVVALAKDGPHPAAAKLFIDFLVSPEGQALYRDADYMPVDSAIPTRNQSLRPDGAKFRSIWFTPERIEENTPKWTGVYNELFR